jgi:arylsulfatase A-like enzyme
VLAELDDQGFLDDSVVIQTSDHGELGGAHQMSGKGATAYQEQNNVPLVIKHPDGVAGATCDSVTSHLDLVPTILGCTGLDGIDAGDLPGRDIGPVLSGGTGGLHDVRDGALFAYNMFAMLDADFLGAIATAKLTGEKPESPPQFDFSKRGAIRSVFDGRYRFSRYFAPTEHHRPETLEDLTARNDLELFDLQSDPDEADNLAADPTAAADIILQMNALMNRLLDEEVGVDDGSFLPMGTQQPWEVERWDV